MSYAAHRRRGRRNVCLAIIRSGKSPYGPVPLLFGGFASRLESTATASSPYTLYFTTLCAAQFSIIHRVIRFEIERYTGTRAASAIDRGRPTGQRRHVRVQGQLSKHACLCIMHYCERTCAYKFPTRPFVSYLAADTSFPSCARRMGRTAGRNGTPGQNEPASSIPNEKSLMPGMMPLPVEK